MSDLRLSAKEITELAKRLVQIDISTETAEAIEKITEGWALSVYLKVRELAESKAAESDNYLVNQHSGSLAPFLFNLIEARLPPDAVKIVLVISLFERSNSGLIERLFKDTEEAGLRGDGFKHAFLKLEQLDSPFLIYLDDDRKWFRIHHLIREILSKRLFQTCPSDQIEKYYKAAGAYFAAQEFFEEGIQYSILGKDIELAVRIITSNWEKLIDHGQNLRLYRWLNMIPAGILNTNPALLVSRAYLCDTFSDFDSMKTYLENASKNIDQQNADPQLPGAFATVHSCFSAYTNDFPTALKYANKALETLMPEQEFLYDYALNFKVFATSMIQSPAQARALIDSHALGSELKGDRHLMRIHVIKMLFDWNQASIKDLKQSGKTVMDISRQENVWWMYKMGAYYLGQYHYIKSQVREGYPYIDAGIDCLFNAGPIWALQLYYSGALAALAENDLSKAHDYLGSAKKFVELNQLEAFEGYLRAFEVEFALRTDDIEKAWTLNASANYAMHPPIYYYYVPQFTQVKLYIQKGDPELMREASDLIQQYKGMCEKLLHARIQISLLEAVWLSRSGLHDKAVNSLSEVIAMTPEDDYIRAFIDMGQPVKELLQALPEEEKQHPLVRNVLNAFRYEPAGQYPSPNKEGLTLKESEIMDLVAKGLQNKEIADQLHLSESTIKTYLYRIYQKLGVKNRYAAMQKLMRSH
jgi:LuxR family maltose regulon positive regulatory protein